MTDQANKKSSMTTLSSGVELGIWSAPSGCTLPTFELTNTQIKDVIAVKNEVFSEFLKKLNRPIKNLNKNSVLAEVLNEPLD